MTHPRPEPSPKTGAGRPFIHDDFVLQGEVARDLYRRFARDLPHVDYHGHLPVEQVARDHRFSSLTELWLAGDHYKWRAMRSNGVPERFCTGDASDWEKFEAWARTVPYTLGNPLYHWTHMELKLAFGVDRLLDGDSARAIYDACNARLAEPAFTARGFLRRFRVAALCTTDDPADSLEHHAVLAADPRPATRVFPTWRPDRALGIHDPAAFRAWLQRLERAADVSITDLGSFKDALEVRHSAFHDLGCRASDHGLETMDAESWTDQAVAAIFGKGLQGREVTREEAAQYRSAMLHHFGLMDHGRGWVQQYHLGALRNNNTRLRLALGPDTGFDSIGDFEMARPLARFLDGLDRLGRLTRTILYNLNPRDNELMASMIGNFQDGSLPGKMQFGAAWWFLDQKDGMEAQIRVLSNMGLLARFVGMTTDSRSFLSFPRHDYFRRILCNLLGEDVERGLIPDQREHLGSLVTDVCFHNAVSYFGLPLGEAASPPA